MQQQRPQECGICLNVYEEQKCRPRTLPCGHSFCSLCVSVLLQDGRLTCPSCCTEHFSPSVDHFPISYALEAMVREFQAVIGGDSAATGEASLSTPRDSNARKVKKQQAAAAGLGSKLQSVIQELQTSLGSVASTLQLELDQLSQYRAQLALSWAEHDRLLEELDKLAQQHRAAIKLLREEDVRVEAFMQEGQEVQREVRAAQGQLQQVSTPQQAGSTIDAADHTTEEAEEWLQQSKEEIPNSNALNTSYKEMETIKAALEAARAMAGAMSCQHTPAPGHLSCTIMEAVDNFKGGPLKLEDLQREGARKRMEAGQVFAVMKHEDGTCYSSKMTSAGDKTLLHSLQPGSPPPGASTLQVTRAVEDFDYCSISVFLDLSWPGISSRRIHISLLADTPLIRWFVTFCLGPSGLTCCSTKYWNLKHSTGRKFSSLLLQETHHQSGTKYLQWHPLQANECGDPFDPRRGMLVALIPRDAKAKTDPSHITQNCKFAIIINNEGASFTSIQWCCLGFVEEAEMSVIEAAVQGKMSVIEAAVQNIIRMQDTSIKVVNSGVVLPS